MMRISTPAPVATAPPDVSPTPSESLSCRHPLRRSTLLLRLLAIGTFVFGGIVAAYTYVDEGPLPALGGLAVSTAFSLCFNECARRLPRGGIAVVWVAVGIAFVAQALAFAPVFTRYLEPLDWRVSLGIAFPFAILQYQLFLSLDLTDLRRPARRLLPVVILLRIIGAVCLLFALYIIWTLLNAFWGLSQQILLLGELYGCTGAAILIATFFFRGNPKSAARVTTVATALLAGLCLYTAVAIFGYEYQWLFFVFFLLVLIALLYQMATTFGVAKDDRRGFEPLLPGAAIAEKTSPVDPADPAAPLYHIQAIEPVLPVDDIEWLSPGRDAAADVTPEESR